MGEKTNRLRRRGVRADFPSSSNFPSTSTTAAGLEDVEIAEIHSVHDAAVSAIIRARKPTRTAKAP
jgi:hypothetical protein